MIVKVLVIIALAGGLLLLNIVLIRANKKTPVPEGCENLTPDCKSCGIGDCTMRGTFERKEDNGNI
jgi:hypothetical protein